MKRFVAMVAIGSEILKADGVEYEGKNYLVPLWGDTTDGLWIIPAYLVPLDRFQHQTTDFAGASFVVNEPVPKELFDHENLTQELIDRYGVILRPPIRIRTAKGLN